MCDKDMFVQKWLAQKCVRASLNEGEEGHDGTESNDDEGSEITEDDEGTNSEANYPEKQHSSRSP